MELTRLKNDINGNPRYVVHFLNFLKNDCSHYGGISEAYKRACKAANKIGGRKYHNKSYGGGIVFQSYNTNELIKTINDNRI